MVFELAYYNSAVQRFNYLHHEDTLNTYYSLTLYPVMVNGIRAIYACGLNKGFASKFSVGSRQEKLEEAWRTHL